MLEVGSPHELPLAPSPAPIHASASSWLRGCSGSQISLVSQHTRSPRSWDEVSDPHINPARCPGSGHRSRELQGPCTYRSWVAPLFGSAVSRLQNATGRSTSGCVTYEHCNPRPVSVLHTFPSLLLLLLPCNSSREVRKEEHSDRHFPILLLPAVFLHSHTKEGRCRDFYQSNKARQVEEGLRAFHL